MAAILGNRSEDIQEVVSSHSQYGNNVVDLTRDTTNDEVQDMEIETDNEQTLNRAENESTQPVNDENTATDETQVQSSMQNVTPVVGRTVQVLGSLAVNSPDEFQNKASKPSKIKPSKTAKSPLKSPEKDDDVSFL